MHDLTSAVRVRPFSLCLLIDLIVLIELNSYLGRGLAPVGQALQFDFAVLGGHQVSALNDLRRFGRNVNG